MILPGQKVFEFLEGETIEYKLTLGSWEKEALNEKGQKSGNNILKISNDTVLVFSHYNGVIINQTFSGQITGIVRYHKKL